MVTFGNQRTFASFEVSSPLFFSVTRPRPRTEERRAGSRRARRARSQSFFGYFLPSPLFLVVFPADFPMNGVGKLHRERKRGKKELVSSVSPNPSRWMWPSFISQYQYSENTRFIQILETIKKKKAGDKNSSSFFFLEHSSLRRTWKSNRFASVCLQAPQGSF